MSSHTKPDTEATDAGSGRAKKQSAAPGVTTFIIEGAWCGRLICHYEHAPAANSLAAIIFLISHIAVTMDKKQAAAFLSVTVRSLQRYTAQGKISARYRKTKGGEEADYDEQELTLLKATLTGESMVRPAVAPATLADELRDVVTPQLVGSLNEFGGRLIEAIDALRCPVQPALLSAAPEVEPQPRVPVESKIMLTVAEAAQLASLSPSFVMKEIKQGKLKGKIVGRGYKVKRADMDAYVRKL